MSPAEDLSVPVFSGTSLTARRGGRLLFAGVDFSLQSGEALVLRGRNGSGKSSLLRLMAGFGRPAAGVFRWQGEAVKDHAELHSARLHYVGHHDALKPALTVSETLRFWCRLSGKGGDVRAGLEAFEIPHLADLPCRFLSAGQRRRLGLARLAAWKAPLWLLDEPTVGLDSEAVGLLARAISRHKSEGGLVIMATHQEMDLPDAQSLNIDAFPPPAEDSLGSDW